MPKAKKRTVGNSNGDGLSAFLRSINIKLDADSPERIQHFRPTAKAVQLVSALLDSGGPRSWLISAPYGSGKSLAATYLLQLVENRGKAFPVLLSIRKRLESVAPELAKFASARRSGRRKAQGIVVALHGSVPSLPLAIQEGIAESLRRLGFGAKAGGILRSNCATIDDALGLLRRLESNPPFDGLDRIVILWDEFGRHLESLVSYGRPSELLEVQTLAEFAARTDKLPMSLGLILHQNVINYAGALPEAARREWTKIEGRLERLEYLDDSAELYRLVAELVQGQSPSIAPPTTNAAKKVAKALRGAGLFGGFNQQDLTALLRAAAPLSPIALYLLPRIAGRVAQNERTLFRFLETTGFDREIMPDALFRFFESSLRSDTGPGGTYRQWLETQSAVAKASTDEEVEALHTCCLLGLGFTGERSRVSRDLLELALAPANSSTAPSPNSVVGALIDKKLLLHRVHSNEVSIWHGTDADLRTRRDETIEKLRASFGLERFLQEQCPPPIWRPVRYNDDFCMRRHFDAEYMSAKRFLDEVEASMRPEDLPADLDGRLIYVIPGSPDELEAAHAAAENLKDCPRLVVAVPSKTLPLEEGALEVSSLMQLQNDQDLVCSDPLILGELTQMEDDARSHLLRLVDRLLIPNGDVIWYSQCDRMVFQGPRDLREWLSKITGEIFRYTPLINNEVINRRKPSPIIINARKKLLAAILEHTGREELGFKDPEGQHELGAAVTAMFRGVLQRTGLYHADEQGRWGFRHHKDISDDGLALVWEQIQDFLTIPAENPKSLERFLDCLARPPYGVRAGVIPILLAAGLRTFPSVGALTRDDDDYVGDLRPSEIEEMCKNPSRYRLEVLALSPDQEEFLHGVFELFHSSAPYEIDEPDLIRRCMEAVQTWSHGLPLAALSTRRLQPRAMAVRTAIQRQSDPVQLLLHELPAALCPKSFKAGLALKRLGEARDEIEGVTTRYYDLAIESFRTAIGACEDSHPSLRDALKEWAACFPPTLIDELSDPRAKPFLSQVQGAFKTDRKLVNSVAAGVYRLAIDKWDDNHFTAFDRTVHSLVSEIEGAALDPRFLATLPTDGQAHLTHLVERRIRVLFDSLRSLVGPDEARSLLAGLSDPKEVTSGQS